MLVAGHTYGLLVLAVVAANFTDAVLTLTWVEMGIAAEANPLMDALLQIGSELFLGVKFTLVNLGTYLLWQFRHLRVSRIGLAAALGAYGFVLYAHVRVILCVGW